MPTMEHTALDSGGWQAGLLRRLAALLDKERSAWRDAEQRRDSAPPLELLAWSRRFLPSYFLRAPSQMHLWLAGQLDAATTRRGARLNVLGPRGGAKSTIGTLAYVLKSALEQTEPYIWIVSDTADQASAHLENVKAELEHNILLSAAYPRAAGRGPRWRSGMAELKNGVVVEAYGAGQHLRGRRLLAHRPTLIVCDDLQNDGHISSAVQREASFDWFHSALLKAGNKKTNFLNLATALHREALAVQLHQAPGWTSALFQAIVRWPTNMELWSEWEEIYCDREQVAAAERARQFFLARRAALEAGAELLWPEEEDLYTLMKMRVEEGRTAFEREKQNSPIDPTKCEWPEEYFGEHIWFHEWPSDLLVRVIALDPSKGTDARHGDYSALVMLGVDRRGTGYVEADLARRPTPQIVADGVRLCQTFRPAALGVESNQFQQLLADELAAELRRQQCDVTPTPINNTVNKVVRIRRLGAYLSLRKLRFNVKSPSTRLLVDQLRDFPLGAHDDGPDALEMAIRLAEEAMHAGTADDGLGTRLIA